MTNPTSPQNAPYKVIVENTKLILGALAAYPKNSPFVMALIKVDFLNQ